MGRASRLLSFFLDTEYTPSLSRLGRHVSLIKPKLPTQNDALSPCLPRPLLSSLSFPFAPYWIHVGTLASLAFDVALPTSFPIEDMFNVFPAATVAISPFPPLSPLQNLFGRWPFLNSLSTHRVKALLSLVKFRIHPPSFRVYFPTLPLCGYWIRCRWDRWVYFFLFPHPQQVRVQGLWLSLFSHALAVGFLDFAAQKIASPLDLGFLFPISCTLVSSTSLIDVFLCRFSHISPLIVVVVSVSICSSSTPPPRLFLGFPPHLSTAMPRARTSNHFPDTEV